MDYSQMGNSLPTSLVVVCLFDCCLIVVCFCIYLYICVYLCLFIYFFVGYHWNRRTLPKVSLTSSRLWLLRPSPPIPSSTSRYFSSYYLIHLLVLFYSFFYFYPFVISFYLFLSLFYFIFYFYFIFVFFINL